MSELEKEKEIKKHMEVLGITREQAEQLWLEDNTDFEDEEMKGMREKAKQNRRYEKSDKPRKTSQKAKKLDDDKVKIISDILTGVSSLGEFKNVFMSLLDSGINIDYSVYGEALIDLGSKFSNCEDEIKEF